MSSEKVGFAGSSQGLLVGVLERPDHAPLQALAVFAHCFTCGKNSLAATRISRALAQQGIATLRFDFTGLGESEGDFGRGGFSSSVADIVAAVHWMQSTIGMPALLVGHSLGGTAAIAAAARLDGIRAVCTLGAPATADHVLRHFGPTKSEEDGQIQVDLGGRAFRIAPAFIEELQAQAHENPVKGLRAGSYEAAMAASSVRSMVTFRPCMSVCVPARKMSMATEVGAVSMGRILRIRRRRVIGPGSELPARGGGRTRASAAAWRAMTGRQVRFRGVTRAVSAPRGHVLVSAGP